MFDGGAAVAATAAAAAMASMELTSLPIAVAVKSACHVKSTTAVVVGGGARGACGAVALFCVAAALVNPPLPCVCWAAHPCNPLCAEKLLASGFRSTADVGAITPSDLAKCASWCMVPCRVRAVRGRGVSVRCGAVPCRAVAPRPHTTLYSHTTTPLAARPCPPTLAPPPDLQPRP